MLNPKVFFMPDQCPTYGFVVRAVASRSLYRREGQVMTFSSLSKATDYALDLNVKANTKLLTV